MEWSCGAAWGVGILKQCVPCRKGRHVQSPSSTIRTSPEPMQILSRIISPTTTPLAWLSWTVWAPGTSHHWGDSVATVVTNWIWSWKESSSFKNATGVVKQGILTWSVHFLDTSLRALAPVLIVIYGQSRLLSRSNNACGMKMNLHCGERSALKDLFNCQRKVKVTCRSYPCMGQHPTPAFGSRHDVGCCMSRMLAMLKFSTPP